MVLGEGLCKLRKMDFSGGPFHKFEKEISAVLDFIYQTQIELAACESFQTLIYCSGVLISAWDVVLVLSAR